MPANPIDVCEREEIRAGLERNEPISVIAKTLGRRRETISREVSRNGGRDRYRASQAQRRADQQRRRPKVSKLAQNKKLAAHVAKRLKAKDSPMTISIELARGRWGFVAAISHETIYQAIHQPTSPLAGLHQHLHLKRRRRKHRHNNNATVNPHSLGEFNPISERPKIADARTEVGHLEGDLIIGAYNRSALATLFDRTSRYLWLIKVANKTADAVYHALVKAIVTNIAQHLRRTLTWDQGAELARHRDLAKNTGFTIYIADKNSPWQRPTNENGNALVRRYVGKGTDLSRFTPKQLRAIQDRINTIPRRSLGWQTANDIYTAAL